MDQFQLNEPSHLDSKREMTLTRKQQLAEQLNVLVTAINRETTVDILGTWNNSGLTYQQVKLILFLDREGTVKMTDISEALGFSKARATSVVNVLCERKLVSRERPSDDRRVVRCKLTKSGKKKSDELIRISPERWKCATDQLGDQQLEDAVRALGTLNEKLAEIADVN